jgi:F0F1-type ATP synthase assembly protein I
MKSFPVKKTLARKAIKTTAKHSAHGTASKLKRNPMRSGTLLVIGALVGVGAGWILGRSAAQLAASNSA